MQVSPVITAPINEIVVTKFDIDAFTGRNREDRRNKPYLPSFKRIPARIIDPATGASTWALGSQR